MSAKPSALLDTRVIYCGDKLDQLRKLPEARIDLSVDLMTIRLFGCWWLDSIAALALIPFLVRESGRTAIRGHCNCC